MTILITLFLIMAPVVYAAFAGRASMNLIDTDIYHRWAFAFFMAATIALFIVFFKIKSDTNCDAQWLEWRAIWLKHLAEAHGGSSAITK